MAVQARRNVDNTPFVLSGSTMVRESETIAREIGRVAVLAPNTVMAREEGTTKWVTLQSVDPAGTPALLTCGALGTTLTGFQAVTDGEFAITVDGEALDITGIDFSDLSAPTDTPAFLTSGGVAAAEVFQPVTDGDFAVTINGVAHQIGPCDFSTVEAPTDTPATLTCGANGAIIAAGWNAVADGQFGITVAGVTTQVGPCDFNTVAVTTFEEVAGVINEQLAGLGVRCEYDRGDDNFVFVGIETGSQATIGELTAGSAGTDISGAGYLNGLAGTGVVVNGTGGIPGITIADVINEVADGLFHVTYDGATCEFVVPEKGRLSTISFLSTSTIGGTDISGAVYLNADAAPAVLTQGTGGIGATLESILEEAAAGRFGVDWDAAGNAMIFTSPTTGQESTITVLSAVAGGAGTDISGAGFLNGLVGTGVVTATTGFTSENAVAGIYVGEEITAAALAAADVVHCPIIVAGTGATIASGKIVLEGGLALTDVIPSQHQTIFDALVKLGLVPEETIDIAGYENT